LGWLFPPLIFFLRRPIYIETQFAWYLLKSPSPAYKPFYQHFYTPRRISQLVISRALSRPQEGFTAFLERFTSRVDIFGRTYLETDLWESVGSQVIHSGSRLILPHI
jgi:DNA (cytosine-5)-methyltransferase 1